VEEQERQENGGEQGARIDRAASSGLKANSRDVVELLIAGTVDGKAVSAKLLFDLVAGRITMEELGSEKRIQSLAMLLSAAPEWKADESIDE
jgi:hypothetical protein